MNTSYDQHYRFTYINLTTLHIKTSTVTNFSCINRWGHKDKKPRNDQIKKRIRVSEVIERLPGDGLLVDPEDMVGHAAGGGELLVADMALEVLGLLELEEDRLVVEFRSQ